MSAHLWRAPIFGHTSQTRSLLPVQTGLVAALLPRLVAGLVAGFDPLPPPAAAMLHTRAVRARRVAPTAVRWSQPSPPRSPVGEWAGCRLHQPARAARGRVGAPPASAEPPGCRPGSMAPMRYRMGRNDKPWLAHSPAQPEAAIASRH